MPKVLSVSVTDVEYAMVQSNARILGQSMSLYVREKLGFVKNAVTVLVENMKKRAANYQRNQRFLLRDLFTPSEWAAYRSEKKHAGIRFGKLVDAGGLPGIVKSGINREGTHLYKRV
jgi:hypothetical protein